MTAEWTLPVLIALPLAAAALPLAVNRILPGYGRAIAATVLAVEAALGAWLASTVFDTGKIVYQVGGAALSRPDGFAVGIELLADPISVLLVLLIAGVTLAVLGFTREVGPHNDAFYSGYLLLAGGLMGIALTHDVFNLFVFMEITSLTTYAMIASDRSMESAVAALKYLIIGTAGASLYLIGVGYLLLATGTLNMTDLAAVLAGERFIETAMYTDVLVQAGFAFIAVGLMVKSAIFPLHIWQPGAYDTAPDDVTAYIAALVSTAGAYALGRIMFTVFTPAFFAANPVAAEVLIAAASISIVMGSLLAAMQHRVKRMLAYSSVAQFGIIVAAFGVAAHPAGSSTALIGGIIHLAGHGMLKAGLFIAAGVLASRYGVRTVSEYAGLAGRFPLGTGAFALLGVALIGIPPSIGFLGKWYIALGAVESGIWPVVAVIGASTVLTLLYVARLLETLYFTPANTETGAETNTQTGTDMNITKHGSVIALAVLLVAAALAIAFGFMGAELHDVLTPYVAEVYPNE